MLTKEQVESIKAGYAGGIPHDVISDICDMALGYLAMQPRPIADANKDDTILGYESNTDEWKLLHWNPLRGMWCDDVSAYLFITQFIPVSSLPKVQP